jgi:aspartate oxidase
LGSRLYRNNGSHIMRQRAEIENRRVVARRLFDALCTQHPDQYIDKYILIQPGDVADDPPDDLTIPKTAE